MSEPARSQVPAAHLAQRLEELLQRGDPEAFLREVAVHSDLAADSHWDVLAIVDQLYRRRKLSPQLFRLARIGIERRALGFHEPAGALSDVPADGRNRAQPHAHSQPELEPEHASQLLHEPQPRQDAQAHQAAQPPAQSVSAERELERMRAELARVQIEAVAQRERAQRLEQQLGQQLQKQQPPPAAPLARPPPPVRTARAPRGRRAWLIAACGALAALVLALMLMRMISGAHQVDVAPSTVAATDAAPVAAAPPVTSPRPVLPPAPSGELAFESDRYVVGPADRQVVITVRRSAGSGGEVAVEWRTGGGGALAGRDFLPPAPAILVLGDQQNAAQITIPILRNPSRKHTEYFDLRLVRATGGASLGQQRRATVFLLPGAGGPRPPAAPRSRH
jgi:hypothetical protein